MCIVYHQHQQHDYSAEIANISTKTSL